eukprot:12905133-Prorocentrum_lima.AAC.1
MLEDEDAGTTADSTEDVPGLSLDPVAVASMRAQSLLPIPKAEFARASRRWRLKAGFSALAELQQTTQS